MKRFITLILSVLFALSPACGLLAGHAGAATFNRNLIMDDDVFSNVGSMNPTQINDFLNGFPSSCISPANGFTAPDPTGYSPSTGYTYGSNVSAGRVIYDAAQAYGLNPQVILATLQKESSVVSGDASYHCQYINTSMGYGCPDSGSCPTNPATMSGFSKQVIHAVWLLRFGQQRSLGNVGWNVQYTNFPQPGDHWDNSDDPPTVYGGPMTQGNRATYNGGATTYYNGWTTIDSTSVHMDSGATAALYWYTPHFSGNQNFFNIFTSWFGGTVSDTYYSCKSGANIAGTTSGEAVLPIASGIRSPQITTLGLLNNTGSKCTEWHKWSHDLQNWTYHVATNLGTVSPANGEIVTADTNGDRVGEMFLVLYRGTGSGKIEIHGWDSTGLHWDSHVATNYPVVDPANYRVISGDFNNDGRDEFALIKYQGTGSGHLEVHIWSHGEQSWTDHIATNYPEIDTVNNRVVAGDFNGDGRDQFALIKYQHTGSGHLEAHIWGSDLHGWTDHIASSYPEIDSVNNRIIVGDYDGNGYDEFELIKLNHTGSGKVELHAWDRNMQGWIAHIASNMPQFTNP